MRTPPTLRLFVSVLLSAGLTGCACARRCVIDQAPVAQLHTVARHLVEVTLLHPVYQLNPWRLVRRAVGVPARAVDLVDGEVPASSFFIERHAGRLSPAEVQQGPTDEAHLPQPPFAVTKVKQEGKTSGFFVTDGKGDRYLFKLDPPASPELLTGAEVVSSKLLYALGYYVPSYEVVTAGAEDFSLDPKLSITPEQFRARIADRMHAGRLRASASRLVDGDILGRISFAHYRCCAELRALKLAYAWLNNTDAKDHNSLLVRQGNRVTGYLIDFGTSLGADALRGPKQPCQGWLYDVDLKEGLVQALTLGLHRHPCDAGEPVFSPAVGRWSPHLDPRRWKPYAPNLAFDAMTEEDAQWMAGRLAQLSRAQVEAAVAAGAYSRPEDAARIVEVLEARRQAIVAAYNVHAEVRP